MRRGSHTGSTCVTPRGAGRGHTGASACRTLKLDAPGGHSGPQPGLLHCTVFNRQGGQREGCQFLETREGTCIFRFLVSFEKIGIWGNTWPAGLAPTGCSRLLHEKKNWNHGREGW